MALNKNIANGEKKLEAVQATVPSTAATSASPAQPIAAHAQRGGSEVTPPRGVGVGGSKSEPNHYTPARGRVDQQVSPRTEAKDNLKAVPDGSPSAQGRESQGNSKPTNALKPQKAVRSSLSPLLGDQDRGGQGSQLDWSMDPLGDHEEDIAKMSSLTIRSPTIRKVAPRTEKGAKITPKPGPRASEPRTPNSEQEDDQDLEEVRSARFQTEVSGIEPLTDEEDAIMRAARFDQADDILDSAHNPDGCVAHRCASREAARVGKRLGVLLEHMSGQYKKEVGRIALPLEMADEKTGDQVWMAWKQEWVQCLDSVKVCRNHTHVVTMNIAVCLTMVNTDFLCVAFRKELKEVRKKFKTSNVRTRNPK